MPTWDGALPDPSILVVSANPQVRERCRSALEGAGLAVITAVDGLEAFRCLAERPYALMLLDWRLPGVTTQVVAAAVRAAFGPTLPIVLLASDGIGLAGALADAARINQPIEPDALLSAVRGILEAAGPEQPPADDPSTAREPQRG